MNRASPLPTVENPWMPSVSSVLWDLMFNKVTRLRFRVQGNDEAVAAAEFERFLKEHL